MQITFGKFNGKTSQEVLIKHAHYAKWVLGQSTTGSLGALQTDLNRLVVALDQKPYTCKCSTNGCARPVSRLTAYANNDTDLYAWCSSCDPYSLGANSGKLSVVNNYNDVPNHVELRCGATKGGYDRIVKAYAKSNGIPTRVGAAAAAKFLA